MSYDFLVTGSGYFEYTTTFQTSLSGDINIFGLKLDIDYDISLATITSISGNTFTWELPFYGDQFPNIGFNYIPASAIFTNIYGDFQEVSAQIIAYKRPPIPSHLDYDVFITCSGDVDYIASFETSLEKEITNFGLTVEEPYDISLIQIYDIDDKTFNWEIPFSASDFNTEGFNNVSTSALFIDTCGNFEEISGTIVAYKICDISVEREYYVQLQANINADIYQDADGEFGLHGAIINKNEETYDLCYNLPTGNVTMKISTIEIIGLEGTQVGTFETMVDIFSSSSGEITAHAYLQGATQSVSIQNDINKAQIVYWDIEPRVESSTLAFEANILTASLDASSASEFFIDKLRTIEALYTTSAIANWEMMLLNVIPGPGSVLDKINDISKTRTLPNFFSEGESITLAFGKTLQMSIQDLEDNTIEIIPPTTIYAVITQNSNAPPLNPK